MAEKAPCKSQNRFNYVYTPSSVVKQIVTNYLFFAIVFQLTCPIMCQGEKESLVARAEHLTDVADGQVEENRKLRNAVNCLERKLELALKAKDQAVNELESSNLMVKTLQSQVRHFSLLNF